MFCVTDLRCRDRTVDPVKLSTGFSFRYRKAVLFDRHRDTGRGIFQVTAVVHRAA